MKTIRDLKEPNKITLDIDVIKHMADHSIDDSETIRQISLFITRSKDRELARILNRKINPMFAYAGLYPEIMTSFDISPEYKIQPEAYRKIVDELLEERKERKKNKDLNKYKNKDKNIISILTNDNTYLNVTIGEKYAAIGTCGITDGILVEGILTKIDGSDCYLSCDRGIPHMCNKKTLRDV